MEIISVIEYRELPTPLEPYVETALSPGPKSESPNPKHLNPKNLNP